LADTIPPQISRLSIRYRKKILSLSCTLRDNISGVDADKLKIQLDGNPIIAEYNPYRSTVSLQKKMTLHAGNHVLTLEYSDRMGNSQVMRQSFPSR